MELKEAYDLDALVVELKALGLDVAEDTAVKALDVVLKFIADSAAKSSTPYDDIVATIIPMFKAEILKQIDKIDGAEG